ncbi:hypothetical protein K4L44_15415 [Halosquirtibacter laminarini]|uniref:Uncharacterized protein n=1 Tax=Halosquirtibacter laminarini TaxID=3374600 RepID=A0AC61NEG6_9BACT|nr:hypothetical protein K4L44_15415 [Prolixibacteraceae bacterium]
MIYKKISILGCGWLGLSLGKTLANSGYNVCGSTTDHEKLGEISSLNIEPYLIKFNPSVNNDFNNSFFNSDILIINIPPKRREDIVSYHLKQFKSILDCILKGEIKKVILVSSTSVYPNNNGEIDEKFIGVPEKNSGVALLQVENLLKEQKGFETTVLRFGGLIGYDRLPGRFLSGKSDIKNGSAPVNLIHRDDCIGIIQNIIENNHWGEVFNGVMPFHPSRSSFYIKAAEVEGMSLPVFCETNDLNEFKIVLSTYLVERTAYCFKYNSPLEAL